MPQFQHNRASIHYEIMGEGAPLLLIAGIASDSASWRPLLPLLAGRQLILIDNRGSGQTWVEGPIAVGEMTDDCAALIAHLGHGPMDVVGHSMGGLIGLDLAVRHARRVKRLVTLGSGAGSAAGRALFLDMSRLYFMLPPADYFRLLYQWLFSDPFFADERVVTASALASVNYPHRQSPGDFARQVAAIDGFGPMPLADIRCPVLAVAGELDLLAPPEKVRKLHEPIASAQHATIAGAAHSIHWEKPAETAQAILDFLR